MLETRWQWRMKKPSSEVSEVCSVELQTFRAIHSLKLSGWEKNVKLAKWVKRIKVERKQRNEYDLETMVCVFVINMWKDWAAEYVNEDFEGTKRQVVFKSCSWKHWPADGTRVRKPVSPHKRIALRHYKFHSVWHIDSRKPSEKNA